MKHFMFAINGIPLPENHNYASIGGASIHVWVMEKDMKSAQNVAISYINQYLWAVKDIEYALEIQPKQLADLDKVEAVLYQKALRDGISATFFAYPKEDGNPNDPIVIGHP